MTPELEILLRTKSFEQLTDVEKALCTQFIDEADYRLYQKILLSATTKNTVEPSPAVEQALHTAMRARSRRIAPIQYVISAPVPFWQAAAAVLLVLSVAFAFLRTPIQDASPMPLTEVHDTLRVTEFIRDTIFVNTPQRIVSVVHDTVRLFSEPTQGMQPIAMNLPNPSAEMTWNGAFNQEKKGYSMREDSIFLKLKGAVR